MPKPLRMQGGTLKRGTAGRYFAVSVWLKILRTLGNTEVGLDMAMGEELTVIVTSVYIL